MPDVSGKRVFILGDSLSSGSSSPGGVLARELTLAGAKVQINAKVGRSAWNFYGREDAAGQLADALAFGPDLVIVELGTNDIGLGMAADRVRMIQIRDAMATKGAKVWGIGPPAFDRTGSAQLDVDLVTAMMGDVFSPRFLNWQALTSDMTTSPMRTSDGVHFTAQGAELAGKRLAREFLSAHEGGGAGLVTLGLIALAAWALFR